MNKAIQQLRKDFKAFNRTEFMYDVYCDRVTFLGFNNGRILDTFFRNRGIIIDADRGGYSISRSDAESLGIPTEKSTYVVNCKDLRKKQSEQMKSDRPSR